MRRTIQPIMTALLCLLAALLVWHPVAAQQGDYTVSLQVSESALADADVKFFVNVRQGGQPVKGIQVTFLVGSTAVGTCITDVNGSCQGGYRFDNAGYYTVTALAGNSSASKGIRIIAPPTPTETDTPTPGPTLPPTLIQPTLNIPTSTPTGALIGTVPPTRTPRPPITVTPAPPTATDTPVPVEALPTFNLGHTPTPVAVQDNTGAIVSALSVVAVLLTIAAIIITVVRVRKYRELTRNRPKR